MLVMAGLGFTVTTVVAAGEVHPATVAVTLYVLNAVVEAAVMVGF
jgi:hypothetical protein